LQKLRSYLKKVFWLNLGVGSSLQVLDILEYVCGLKLGPALILNQNPFFEMASTIIPGTNIMFFQLIATIIKGKDRK